MSIQPTSDVKVDVLQGHLGHLTETQQEAFASFRKNLAEAKLYEPAEEGTSEHPSHDEPTLLRFLRARRFDPKKAQKQFADAEAWRAKNNVDELYATFPADEFEASKRFYPRWTGRRDKNGLPVYVYRIGSLDSTLQKELNAVPSERRYQRIVALYETMTRFVLPLCTYLPHATAPTPISSVTTIIDLEDVSLSTLWNWRKHLQEASTLATANYPETLSTIAVVNSPSFFPTVWGWIKPWFDEGTRNKVFVLGKDPGPTLRTLIAAEDLPKPYGGDFEWTFEDEPALDAPAREAIGEMPKGPAVFVDGKVVQPPPAGRAPVGAGQEPQP
ncbi:Sec14p-like lipid-binding domain-containing protein [Phanerochaete sordida]|uniref:Sec14p-like lipid-binding domain-containing protein n=1 Tax=Phanerochaete sordida TaxID=48140 RepID=A0A9P3LEN5_9APHY|nr:Sec14p-like lipid-binding domain-containing protein [Phanerochaete sordida]